MQDIPRRRKRKTTERVADLEEKINALTALLAAKEAGSSTTDSDFVPPQLRPDDQEPLAISEETLMADALSRGVLDWDTASAAFDKYKQEMSQYFPFVVFPDSMVADDLREQQPLLFFGIVTVSTSRMPTQVDSELCEMLIKDLALRIMYKGERSLELVQTLLVHIFFYSRALQMRDLNFNQMTHIATTMATDIGLGRRPHKATSAIRNGPYELESLAARRAWLGCYYMATRYEIITALPTLLTYTQYFDVTSSSCLRPMVRVHRRMS